MLKQLKISNFRGFGNETTVRFAPITILIGKNNSGKSSIIKFLLMLRQSLPPNSTGFLVTQGDHVNLGRFYNIKNTLSRKRYLNFSLIVAEESSPRDALSIYLNDMGVDRNPQRKFYTVESNILYSQKRFFQGKDHSISLTVEDNKLLERSTNINPDSLFLDFSDEHQRELTQSTSYSILKKIHAEKSCIETLIDKIGGLSHILPIKKAIRGSIDTSTIIPNQYVGNDGNYAIHHLWKIINEGSSNQQDFIFYHMQEILGINEIEFKVLDRLALCNARNQQTGAQTNIEEFGFGVSECIPVLIQGAIMSPGTTLMVEQPETQVHPTAQISLGQFFANLWKQRKVSSIIETHSGNILLRLRRLIRRGELSSQEVSVAFFDCHEEKPMIKNLDINEDGSFEPGLPMEFFGADIIEGLNMGAGE